MGSMCISSHSYPNKEPEEKPCETNNNIGDNVLVLAYSPENHYKSVDSNCLDE
jgi:hypothetical protein